MTGALGLQGYRAGASSDAVYQALLHAHPDLATRRPGTADRTAALCPMSAVANRDRGIMGKANKQASLSLSPVPIARRRRGERSADVS
jgi:hypothetical protein